MSTVKISNIKRLFLRQVKKYSKDPNRICTKDYKSKLKHCMAQFSNFPLVISTENGLRLKQQLDVLLSDIFPYKYEPLVMSSPVKDEHCSDNSA